MELGEGSPTVYEAVLGRLDLAFDLLPHQAWRDLFAFQVAVDLVMAPLFGVLGKVGQ